MFVSSHRGESIHAHNPNLFLDFYIHVFSLYNTYLSQPVFDHSNSNTDFNMWLPNHQACQEKYVAKGHSKVKQVR